MDPIMKELVDFAYETKFKDLPREVVGETKRILLDSIGCALGAYRMKRAQICAEEGQRTGGKEESTIFGSEAGKVPSLNAAFANGELITALDLDALYGTHLPPYVIPSPLAVGESLSSSGEDIILATALGLEIARRVQMATPPPYGPKSDGSVFFSDVSGHSPAAFGAAVGAGKILGLNAEKLASAIGIAGYAAPPSTFRKWTDTTPCRMTKYGPPGFTAEVGVRSAVLANAGYYGDTDIFQGDYCYWRFAGHQKWNVKPVTEKIGRQWKCLEVSYKKYPAGH